MKGIILVVDDDKEILEIIKYILKDFHVLTASNGKEALELFTTHKPDIVLMDLDMPKMNGVETAREIKKIDPNVVVIVVSACSQEYMSELLEMGVEEIIEKPFSINRIREIVIRSLKASESFSGGEEKNIQQNSPTETE